MVNKLRYPEDEDLRFEEKHKQNVLQAVKKDNVVHLKGAARKKRRKILYSVITAAAIFVVFIVSSYFSPVMAKVAANIPYFSLFIKQEEYKYAIYEVISEVGRDKKYNFNTIDVSVPDREMTISVVGTKAEVKKLKTDVIKNVNAELRAQNFGAYEIRVKQESPDILQPERELTAEEKLNEQKTNELQGKVEEYLKKNNYITPFPPQVRINKIENYMYVSITKTEKREAELEQAMRGLSQPYGGNFKIDIRKSDMTARQQEIRWEEKGLISIIVGGLMENKEFKVKGFSYSFHPLPLQIKVKTSVKSTDSEAKELAERIKNEIDTFIQTDELTKEVRNDPYVVTVYGKDKKKIK
ncbi:DUF4030 domain-containing protein [Peribacillus deserti]|uniref:DUF4179 domain-containing protein n=1 Tax=Peribacillus deserti TaxID=673318 RepID=A0A2N5M9M0_9BACI|nr:DUF4030 domain-containing protein [Peribacillus deserti]PLT31025.1 hypothetical protein CUU66_04260 [Peribacillus deserti]